MVDPKDSEIAKLKAENQRLVAAIQKFLMTEQRAINDTLYGTVEGWVSMVEALPAAAVSLGRCRNSHTAIELPLCNPPYRRGSHHVRQETDSNPMMGGTREPEPATKTIIKDRPIDSQASLPQGTLKGPFLDRQGDEQREPSEAEKEKLEQIQQAQNEPKQ